jgi:hypothetical protein
MQQTQTGRRTPTILMVVAALILLAVPVGVFAAGNLTGGNTGAAASGPITNAPAAGTGPRLADMALYAAPNGTGGTRKTFSASADNEIYVQMRWINLDSGIHDAYVTLTSPDHTVYQVLDVTFTGAVPNAKSTAPQTIQRPGVLHPTIVQAATTTPGGSVVTGQVPIAGTWMGRLQGAWQITVKLDTNPKVLATYPFTLNQ